MFVFTGLSDKKTEGYIRDSEMVSLAYHSSASANRNFSIQYVLYGGVTYVLEAGFFSKDVTGTVTVTLEQKPRFIRSFEITKLPDRTQYVSGFGDKKDLSGMEMNVIWSDGKINYWSYDEDGKYVKYYNGRIYESYNISVNTDSESDGYTTTLSVHTAKASFFTQIIDNPVESIEVVKGTSFKYIENTEGYTDSRTDVNGDTADFFCYEAFTPEDAVVRINYLDGTHIDATVGSKVNGYTVEWDADQSNDPWTVGTDNETTVSYLGFEAVLNVEVIENSVESIEMISESPLTYYENVNGYTLTDDSGNEYFCYDTYGIGDRKIKVNYADGTSKVARIADGLNGYEFNISDSQRESHWTLGGEAHLTVEYLGATCQIPVEIVENPVASVELITAPSREYFYGDLGFGYVSNGNYYINFNDFAGLSFKVNYTDGTSEILYGEDIVYDEYFWEYMINGVPFYGGYTYRCYILNGNANIDFEYMGFEVDYKVSVKKTDVISVEVVKAPDNSAMTEYALPDFKGMEIKITYSDETSETVKVTEDNMTCESKELDGVNTYFIENGVDDVAIRSNLSDRDDVMTFTVNYQGVEFTYDMPVVRHNAVKNVTVNGTVYEDLDGAVFKVEYADGTSDELQLDTVFYGKTYTEAMLVMAKTDIGIIEATVEAVACGGELKGYYVDIFGTTVFAPVAIQEVVYGDVNLDGKVNISDCILIKRSILQTYELSSHQELRANINGDTRVNIADYVLAKRIILKTYSKEFVG